MLTSKQFKRWFKSLFVGISSEERMQELHLAGMLLTEHLVARRCFQVKEFEDEGLHLFLELVGGAVLYTGGQALYEYGPNLRVEDGGFPSTEFRLVTHRAKRYIVSLECTGTALVPEHVFPAYQPAEFRQGLRIPAADVEVLEGRSYEELVKAKGRLFA